MKRMSLVCILGAGLAACGGDDEDGKKSTAAASVGVATFASEDGLTELDRKGLEEAMGDFDDLAENDRTEVKDALHLQNGSCAPFNGGVRANGDTLDIQVNGDLGACLGAFGSFIFERTDRYTMAIDMHAVMQCPGADFSALNGKSVTELGNEIGAADFAGQCPADKPRFVHLASVTINSSKGKTRSIGGIGGTVTINDVKMPAGAEVDMTTTTKTGWFGANGERCKEYTEGGIQKAENCWKFDRKEIVGTVNGEKIDRVIQSKVDMSAVTGVAANKYYNGGVAKVTVNGWTGEVTFDGTRNPAWKMTKGSETVSGKLGSSFTTSTNPTATATSIGTSVTTGSATSSVTSTATSTVVNIKPAGIDELFTTVQSAFTAHAGDLTAFSAPGAAEKIDALIATVKNGTLPASMRAVLAGTPPRMLDPQTGPSSGDFATATTFDYAFASNFSLVAGMGGEISFAAGKTLIIVNGDLKLSGIQDTTGDCTVIALGNVEISHTDRGCLVIAKGNIDVAFSKTGIVALSGDGKIKMSFTDGAFAATGGTVDVPDDVVVYH